MDLVLPDILPDQVIFSLQILIIGVAKVLNSILAELGPREIFVSVITRIEYLVKAVKFVNNNAVSSAMVLNILASVLDVDDERRLTE